jgi:hypothetical protein
MPIEKKTAKELLGDKPVVLSAKLFHRGLKQLSDKRGK